MACASVGLEGYINVRTDKDPSNPVPRHVNLPDLSHKDIAVCGISLRDGNTESRKTLEQKFISQTGTHNPHGINERFSFDKFIFVYHVTMLPPIA